MANTSLIMEESGGNVVCIRVCKLITADDFTDHFLPYVRDVLKEHSDIRVLISYESYHGWTEEAAAEDMHSLAENARFVTKIALVNPPEQEIRSYKMRQQVFKGGLRFFAKEDFAEALEWVRS